MAQTIDGMILTEDDYGSFFDMFMPLIGEDPNRLDFSHCEGEPFGDIWYVLEQLEKLGIEVPSSLLVSFKEDAEALYPYFHSPEVLEYCERHLMNSLIPE